MDRQQWQEVRQENNPPRNGRVRDLWQMAHQEAIERHDQAINFLERRLGWRRETIFYLEASMTSMTALGVGVLTANKAIQDFHDVVSAKTLYDTVIATLKAAPAFITAGG